MKLRAAVQNDLEQLVNVRIAAYSDLPLWKYWYHDREKYAENLRDLVRADCEDELDECFRRQSEILVVEEDSVIIAFSVWNISVTQPKEPEGQSSSSGTTKIKFDTKVENVPRIKAVGEVFRKARKEFFWDKYGKHQRELTDIGTNPDHWRRGAARMMIEAGLEKAAKANEAVTLFASPMGKAAYGRFNFVEVGSKRAQVEGEQEHVEVFCMAWEPPVAVKRDMSF